jgi:hypothetical protein
LPDVAVVPSEHFNTVTYSGTNATQSISVGFQPDFIWQKARSSTQWHRIIDSVRGGGNLLYSNSTAAEDTGASLSFISDGFTFTGANGYNANDNSVNYVGWNWKANGSGSSNTNGSINTTKTSANVDAGFSMITYTGTGSAATIGHGLSKAPEMVIVKRRDTGSSNWWVYHKGNTAAPETDGLRLDGNNATTDDNFWNDTAPTSSLIHLGTYGDVNASSGTYISYCFHSVQGYSAVGSYTGNGTGDGPFIYTGFRVGFMMIKRTDSTGPWLIFDSGREPYNDGDLSVLSADASSAEPSSGGSTNDIVSNGFKVRGSTDRNTSGGTYIYLAFAETPFKYSNAR